MKCIRRLSSVILLLLLAQCLLLAAEPDRSAKKIRVLVVTGGHDFEKQAFFKLFKDNPEIAYEAVEHPNAHARLRPDAVRKHDVLVLYDMWQPISDEAKQEFLARLRDGTGLVVLHHAIASYQDWPEYTRVIGAHYYLEPKTVDGVKKPRSAYKHGMHFKIHIADMNHPVTQGVQDFEMHDETYKWFDVAPDARPLLTTDEPESNKVIGWAKTYEAARIVYLQSGHDHFAYENPNYQRLLRQAIRWTAYK